MELHTLFKFYQLNIILHTFRCSRISHAIDYFLNNSNIAKRSLKIHRKWSYPEWCIRASLYLKVVLTSQPREIFAAFEKIGSIGSFRCNKGFGSEAWFLTCFHKFNLFVKQMVRLTQNSCWIQFIHDVKPYCVTTSPQLRLQAQVIFQLLDVLRKLPLAETMCS